MTTPLPEDKPPVRGMDDIPTRGAPILDAESCASAQLRALLSSRAAKILLVVVGCAIAAAWISSILGSVSSHLAATRAKDAAHEGRALTERREFTAAIPRFDEALAGTLPPRERARCHLDRGWCYMNVGRDLEAIPEFDAAISLDAKLVNAWLDRGIVFHRRRDFDRAMADYTQAIALSEKCVDAYRNRSLIFAQSGRMTQAIADMDQAIRWAPDDVRWPIRRGQFFNVIGNRAAALEDFDRALRIDFENPDARHRRAAVLADQGEDLRAMAELNALLNERPQSAGLYLARGMFHMDESAYEEAIEDCAEAIRLAPKVAGPYALRAAAELSLGGTEAALAFTDMALQLDRKLPMAHQIRGVIFNMRGEYSEALAAFERAIAFDFAYVAPVIWRARTRGHAGQYQQAHEELQAAVRTYSGVYDTHMALAWFLATCPEPSFRDGERALIAAEKAVEVSREEPRTLDVLAAAYAELGAFPQAIETELRAIDKTSARALECGAFGARLMGYRQGTPFREVREF